MWHNHGYSLEPHNHAPPAVSSVVQPDDRLNVREDLRESVCHDVSALIFSMSSGSSARLFIFQAPLGVFFPALV